MRNTNVAISKRFSSRGRVFLWLSTWWVLASPCPASLPPDLTELSVEALMRVEITTVSKKGYQLFETPAAVYVLTREDLARSGIRSLPDALRLVPGLFIAQVDANKWVVTSRGFSGVFSNKLLVLIDGRSVYTPLFSGVF